MKKILIIQSAFIGDAILATALLEQLHATFPTARIDFLIRKGNETLFLGHPFLHEVLIWDKKQGKYKNLWHLLKTIRRTKYDLLINVQRFASMGLLTALSNATVTVGFDTNICSRFFSKKVPHIISNTAPYLHEVQRNFQLIQHYTNNTTVAKPKLYPTPKNFAAVATYKIQPYVCIAPTSVWFTKQYPKEKWIALMDQIPKKYKVYLLGAIGDKNICDAIGSSCENKQVINLCGQLSFLDSAALMKDATMNYVNDSAPMHLASAINANVTVVYCSTIPAFGFYPLSDKNFIIEVGGEMTCRPCGLHGKKACPQKHFNCAMQIETNHLLDTLNN